MVFLWYQTVCMSPLKSHSNRTQVYLHLGRFCCRAHNLVCTGPFFSLYLHFSTSIFSVCSSYKNKVSQSKVYVSEFHPQVINVCVKVRSSLWWEWLTHWLKLVLLQIFGNRFFTVYCCCIRKHVMLDLSSLVEWIGLSLVLCVLIYWEVFFFLPLKHSRGLHRQSDIYTAYRSKLHQLSLSFYHFEVGTLQCGVGIRISLGHLTLTKPMCRCTGTLCVVYGDNL